MLPEGSFMYADVPLAKVINGETISVYERVICKIMLPKNKTYFKLF